MPTALYHVYWVDQRCPNAPQTKVRVYNHLHVSDELEAYSKFQKEVKEQNDGT
jgi:hypothetical protein